VTRHIAVLTGKRGGFGAMKPMLHAIMEDSELRLSLIVTDQHLNPIFGKTISEIRREFPIAAEIDISQSDGSALARSRALGACLLEMSSALHSIRPDILVLYGDRGEVLASALAAIHLDIPIAHIQGGDRTGNVDESMRHALTKLAHLHFASTEESAVRIRKMGEEEWRIHVVGDSHVDQITAGNYSSPEVVRDRYRLQCEDRPILFLLHPETVVQRDSYTDAKAALGAVLAREKRTIVVFPCSDHGYEGIIAAIKEIEGRQGVSVHQNIDAPDFWGLMAMASVMVGNSSAGLIEAPYFRLPAVNIGRRQRGRQRAENVIDCDYGEEAVTQALSSALDDAETARRVAQTGRPFGDGLAFRRIVDKLKSVELGQRLLEKQITY